jgi:hypothetical protein
MAASNVSDVIVCKRCDEGRTATHIVKSDLLDTLVCDVCAAVAYDFISRTRKGNAGEMIVFPMETTKHAGG